METKKNQKQGPVPDDLNKLIERQSPGFISDYVLNGSSGKWVLDDLKEEALTYHLKFEVESDELDRVKRLTADHPLFHFNNPMKGDFSVAHSSTRTKVQSNGKGIHGNEFTYITDKKNGFVFLDKASKTYLSMPADRKTKHQYNEKISGKVELSHEGKITEAIIQLKHPKNIRYVLKLDTNKKFLPYSKSIITMILGGPDRYTGAGLDLEPIIKTGIPVSGEVFLLLNDDQWKLISSFSISELQIIEDSKKLFIVPEGYRDLIQVNKQHKKEGKPTAFGPPVRMSDFRRNMNFPGGRNAPGNDIPQPKPDDREGAKDHRDGGTKPDVFKGNNFEMPVCFPETYGALLANLVDEKLLDDVKFLVNAVSKRMTGFGGSGGTINIDWLRQFQNQANALADSDPGGGLYTLLHDESATNVMHPQKLGLLDKLAISNLSNLLASGDNLLVLGLATSNPALQARINAILADTGIAPENRFTSFTLPDQGLIVDAYMFSVIGLINLSYPDSTGTKTVFYGLLNVRVDNIDFDIKINNTAIINTLAFDPDSIHFVISLPDASGKAWTSRWPTAKYWGLVGISVISCFFFPFTCFLMDMAILIGIFIGLDLAFVTLDLANIMVDSHIRLVPNASNVLQPDVTLQLDADVSAFYMSVIPTGIHQILSLIYDIILNSTSLILDTLESQLRDQLNDYLKNDLKITYPPAFGPVTLSGLSNAVEFVDMDRGYVEQALDAGIMGIINPYVTQIDSIVKPNILKLRDEFKGDFQDPVDKFVASGSLLGFALADLTNVARYYLGTVLSQNFINDYVYTLWRQQKYNYNFTDVETEMLINMLILGFPALKKLKYNKMMHAHLWPAVPPRTLFTPKPASEGSYYSTTFFDDVRICFELGRDNDPKKGEINKIEFAFAGQTYTEIGFGGINDGTGKLDLLKMSDRLFDIYFDLKNLGVVIIHAEVQYFAIPGMQPSVTFDYSPLNSLQSMLETGLAFSLARHDSAFIPRKNTDPVYLQRYPLGNDALQVVFQLVPFRGNMYISKGITGLATAALEGALNVDTLDKTTAGIILAFT